MFYLAFQITQAHESSPNDLFYIKILILVITGLVALLTGAYSLLSLYIRYDTFKTAKIVPAKVIDIEFSPGNLSNRNTPINSFKPVLEFTNENHKKITWTSDVRHTRNYYKIGETISLQYSQETQEVCHNTFFEKYNSGWVSLILCVPFTWFAIMVFQGLK